ncbi:hypothetical protein KPH14_012079 [Odynerus spinipes]|uniref:Uncharacterized protein n=1 Tax=Odynerus spinipes TaxID=1348599 RepID=A0AAD9VIA2_9HYME|nr:hypothetical protein KPH14_012079 [Odynerus spinipes]
MSTGKNKRSKLTPKPNLIQRSTDKLDCLSTIASRDNTASPEPTETLQEIITKIRKENDSLRKELNELKKNQLGNSSSQTIVKERAKQIEESQAAIFRTKNRFEILSSEKASGSSDPNQGEASDVNVNRSQKKAQQLHITFGCNPQMIKK